MDGLDELINALGESVGNLFSEPASESASESISGSLDLPNFPEIDIDLDNCSDVLSGLANGSFIGNSQGDFYSSMENAFNTFLDSSNSSDPSFGGSIDHHDPFQGDPDYDSDGSEISFTGNGDKYTDNSYNQEQAKKWLAIEQDKLAKGDIKGAESARNIAKDHLRRIK